jgi:lipid-A-disaccharide synthase
LKRIGILAGGGRLPLMLAESATRRGASAHIIAIEGEADPAVQRYPHTWVNWGEFGRMLAILRAEGGGEVVIAGGVRRPDLFALRPDLGFFASLPRLARLLAGGDDAVLSRVVRLLEAKGLIVRGAHEVAPELLAERGAIGGVAASQEARTDAALAAAVRAAIGPFDVGQAVVVAAGRVLAIEAAEGTDAMLARVASLRQKGLAPRLGGVLSKGPKPGQELRVDMPAIGPRTIEAAAAAELEAVAVDAGAVLVLDRAEAVRLAAARQCALLGLTPATPPGALGPSGLAARLLGRMHPSRRDLGDLERGVAATLRLKRFGTGAGAVVARAYILALEAAEGAPALLERGSALKPWGRAGRGRAGVLIRRIDAAEEESGLPERLIALAALNGLAGVAVVGSGAAIAAWERAGRHADRARMFLVSCAPTEPV